MKIAFTPPSLKLNSKEQKPSSAESILKLRRLISDFINEVDLLDCGYSTQEIFHEDCDSISFYREVEQFEIALIRVALKKSGGNQLKASRLLNLNHSTLNSKIKQYKIRQLWFDGHRND